MLKMLYVKKYKKRNGRKRTFGRMRPAKIQIRLRMRAVWSESSLGALWTANQPRFLRADSEGCNQTARMRRMIYVFAGRTCRVERFRPLRSIKSFQIIACEKISYLFVKLLLQSSILLNNALSRVQTRTCQVKLTVLLDEKMWSPRLAWLQNPATLKYILPKKQKKKKKKRLESDFADMQANTCLDRHCRHKRLFVPFPFGVGRESDQKWKRRTDWLPSLQFSIWSQAE